MKSLLLTGFRGSGKTTLGRELARRLAARFVDMDEEWEARRGIPILAFVAAHGIEVFRGTEAELLEEILTRVEASPERWVVATGGGFVESDEARARVARSTLAKVFLDPPVDELWARLEAQPERRKIGDLADFTALERLWAFRRPFYEKIATHSVRSRDIKGALTELESLARAL